MRALCPAKAPEGWRTPRCFAFAGSFVPRASVLECAGPPALSRAKVKRSVRKSRIRRGFGEQTFVFSASFAPPRLFILLQKETESFPDDAQVDLLADEPFAPGERPGNEIHDRPKQTVVNGMANHGGSQRHEQIHEARQFNFSFFRHDPTAEWRRGGDSNPR